MAGIDDVFNALFLGSGSWLGLLLLLTIIVGLVLKAWFTGVLMLPISVFLGISYLDASLSWHAIIMFFCSIFIVVYMMQKGKSEVEI